MKELEMWQSYATWLSTLTTQYLIDMLPNCQKQEIYEVGGELTKRGLQGDKHAEQAVHAFRKRQVHLLNAYIKRRSDIAAEHCNPSRGFCFMDGCPSCASVIH